jgi:hypothetical protein
MEQSSDIHQNIQPHILQILALHGHIMETK